MHLTRPPRLLCLPLFPKPRLTTLPTGDNAYRSGIYDAILMGCVPVVFTDQASILKHRQIGGILERAGLKMSDVFCIIDIKKSPRKIFAMLLAEAQNKPAMERRMGNLRLVASRIMVTVDDTEDLLAAGIGAMLAGVRL